MFLTLLVKAIISNLQYVIFIFIMLYVNTFIHELGHATILILFKPSISTIKSIKFCVYGLKGYVYSEQIKNLTNWQKRIAYSAGFAFNLLFIIPLFIHCYLDYTVFYTCFILSILTTMTFVTSSDFKVIIHPDRMVEFVEPTKRHKILVILLTAALSVAITVILLNIPGLSELHVSLIP